MKQKPLVIVTEGLKPRPLDWLRERAEVVEIGPGDAGFAGRLAKARGLVVRTYTQVTAEMLSQAPQLAVVGRAGVGLENIDIAACRKRGVRVVYTPDANTRAVAEFVFGAILQLIRPWAPFHREVYSATEFKRIRDTMAGRELDELTIGILGMGRVGRRVGRIAASGFGMKVLFNDLLDVAGQLDFPAEAVDKRTLFRRCDILTIHVDMRPRNRNLVGLKQLALLKPTALVVNTSRGEVLDAAALAEALRAGKVFGAALDVFAPEPPAADFPLLGLPNVLLTPHLAARTATAMENMSWVVRDVMKVLEGREPKFPAD